MKTTLILIALLSLASCGAKKVYHTKVNIHPDAQSFVSTFEQKSNIKIRDLEVTFSDKIADGILGYCQVGSRTERKATLQGAEDHIYATPTIVLNSNYWYTGRLATDSDREQLVYHELGHCILGRPHVNSASSIMFPYHLTNTAYLADYARYMAELFNKPLMASSGMRFQNYASTIYPEFEEFEVVVPADSEIRDCIHDKGHELIQVPVDEE
jgi:hypothetical protein